MFIALRGKSQFKIKVIHIHLWFVACSHVKNFVVIGHFTNQHFQNISGIQSFKKTHCACKEMSSNNLLRLVSLTSQDAQSSSTCAR